MSMLRLLRAALSSIARNRMRSLLTSLGIIIGVSAVIIMVSIAEGTSASIKAEIDALGTNLLMIRPGSTTSSGAQMGAGSLNRFTFDDVEDIAKNATLIDAVSPVVRSGAQIVGGGSNWSTTVNGVWPSYLRICNWEVESGEAFTERDVSGNRKVVLLGATVAEELFGETDPVGQTVRVRSIPMTVVGVLKAKGSGMGGDQDDVVLAPATTVLYRLKGRQWVDMINASASPGATTDEAVAELKEIIRGCHKLEDGEDDDFTIRSQEEIAETVSSMTRTMTLLLGSIAAVSLLVGGIGIMNIMLVSVTERTREIGIRLSVGARESDIMVQFLTEAMVLSLAGGIVGVALSFATVAGLNRWSTMQPIIAPYIVVLSFVFSAAIGIFFGLYPARKAAALDPIEALRHE